ncbi:MAG TPA: ISAs1 family transposase [Mycobacterium sp.]|nr:ISAs1 family transposase [Mycobacterium sp.]
MPVSHAATTCVDTEGAEVGLAEIAELYALFTQVTDPRAPRGVRHGIATVLTVMVLVVLAGARNFREAGDQAADLPGLLLRAARARRDRRTGALVAPSASTLRRVVENIDTDAADLLVCQWIAARARRPQHSDSADGGTADRRHGIAIDGKTIRRSGAGDPDANVKLFSAMRHEQAVIIAQICVPHDTNEITQVGPLLDRVDLAGAVVTGDAAHTQTGTARYLQDRGADYVLTLKANKPTLLATVAAKLFAATDTATDTEAGNHLEIDRGHGRIVHRQIWTTTADGIDFPGAAQIFRIRRDVFNAVGERISKEIVHGITSLDAHRAAAEAVAAWVRQHWGVENKIHWVRDVVFAEDHQNAYLGAAAHGMALFRNLAIGLIRLAGHTQIKRTLQHIAGDRTRILPLLAASRP